jgi:hypothetical protein
MTVFQPSTVYILSASIAHSPPSIATNDGRLYTVTHALAMVSLLGYRERVWLLNTSADGSDPQWTHYIGSSAISASCSYDFFTNISAFRPDTSIDNDYQPDGDKSSLSFPGCAAFMTLRISFLLFWIIQIAFYVVFALGTCSIAKLSSQRATAQRDVHRAEEQKRRLIDLNNVWKTAVLLFTFPAVPALVSLIAIIAFVHTAGFEDAQPGPFFACYVAGIVAYLTVLPLCLWAYKRLLDDENSRMQGLGLTAEVAMPAVSITTANSGFMPELQRSSSDSSIGSTII